MGRAARGKRREVRYLRTSSGGRRLTGLLRAIGFSVAEGPEDVGLGDLRGSDGANLIYEVSDVADRIGEEVADGIDAGQRIVRQLKRRYRRDYIRLYLRRSAIRAVHDVVRDALVLWRQAERHTGDTGADRHVLLVRRTPFQELIQHGLRKRVGAAVHTYRTVQEVKTALRQVAALLRHVALSLRAAPRRAAPSVGPRIAVQYAAGTDWVSRSDVFWYPDSGLTPDQVLVYFNRPDHPRTEASTEHVGKLGLEWVDLLAWKPGGAAYARSIVGTLRVAVRLGIAASIGRLRHGWWQWRTLVLLERTVDWWSAFFREHNVRVHLHVGATSPDIVALALAVEQEGGIDVGYQWSADDFSFASTGRILSKHVFFAWGPLYAEQIRQLGFEPDVLLLGGQVFDFRGGTARAASRWRNELRRKGCLNIVSVFDNSFLSENPLTPAMVTEFYRTVFSWVQRDSSLGLIVKPKPKYPSVFDRLPEVKALLEKAQATGRCLLLSGWISPGEAALASDLAVGLGMNTAVLESALAGVPAVHLDLGSLKRHPLRREGLDRFVFCDADVLYERMQAWRNDPLSVPGFADHSPVLDSIDPFRDGGGPRRLGTFLRWFLEELEEGKSREQAVLAAAHRYATEVGEAYVRVKAEAQ